MKPLKGMWKAKLWINTFIIISHSKAKLHFFIVWQQLKPVNTKSNENVKEWRPKWYWEQSRYQRVPHHLIFKVGFRNIYLMDVSHFKFPIFSFLTSITEHDFQRLLITSAGLNDYLFQRLKKQNEVTCYLAVCMTMR